ncbi:MAG: hypothetical protein Ta2A_06860 [Treponemataceae bacterium]|nr:MAG: hypothetical protein Ta2A_06860 [Treponemataceae bacterium]
MFFFCIKKNFYDGWDNLFLIALINVIILLIAALFFFAGQNVYKNFASAENPLPLYAIAVLAFFTLAVLLFASGKVTAEVANYKSQTIKDFFESIAATWKRAILSAVVFAAFIGVVFISFNFYIHLQVQPVFGYFLAAVVFWLFLITAFSMQYFIPLNFLQDNTFAKALKKSFILFFDNPAYSIFFGIYLVLLAIISVVPCLFLFPSFSGIILAQTNSLKLRLYKYDWLEAQNAATTRSKHIPWDELIAEDRETVGNRSLKNFIFPWKD